MSLTTFTYYFRLDGTYAKDFDKPDWKTRVDGTYTLKGKTITLSEIQGDKPDTMEIQPDGDIDDGSYTLFKLNVMNSVPAKRLENKSASSSGGGMTGMTYVGVFSKDVLTFDGKGSFTNDGNTDVAIIGDAIGGGTSKSKNNIGSYSVKDSALTLNYPDGKKETVSFFYAEKPEVMALINGSFYYEYDEKDKEKTVVKTENKPIENKADALKILQTANIAQGGAKLDNLKTLRVKGNGMGLEITILVDVENQKICNELRMNGKLVGIEQTEGNSGWQWMNNQKTPLAAKRLAEMNRTFSTGILGLRNNSLKSFAIQSAELKSESNMKTVIVDIEGEKYGMIFDANDYLVGEITVSADGKESTISKDFKKVDGIVFPFSSTTTSDTQTLVVNFTSVEVNPVFAEKTWEVPN